MILAATFGARASHFSWSQHMLQSESANCVEACGASNIRGTYVCANDVSWIMNNRPSAEASNPAP